MRLVIGVCRVRFVTAVARRRLVAAVIVVTAPHSTCGPAVAAVNHLDALPHILLVGLIAAVGLVAQCVAAACQVVIWLAGVWRLAVFSAAVLLEQ